LKRLLSLTLTVAMLAALITAAVPAALANARMVFYLRPAPGTPVHLEPGDKFKMEVFVDNPSRIHIGAINNMRITYDFNFMEWDLEGEYGLYIPFRSVNTERQNFIEPAAIFSDARENPLGFNAFFHFTWVSVAGATADGVLMELDFVAKVPGPVPPVTLTIGSIGLPDGRNHLTTSLYRVESYPDRQAYPVTVNGITQDYYVAGETVFVSSGHPPAGQMFSHWTASGIAATQYGGIWFPMPPNAVSVTANFKDTPTYNLTVIAGSNGTVSGTASGSYHQGVSVEVTASPINSDYEFVNWTGVGDGLNLPRTGNPLTFFMPGGNVSLTANFARIPVNDVFVNGAKLDSYKKGTVVNISAGTPPIAGHLFAGWRVISGGVSIIGMANASFVMPDVPVSVEATWNAPGAVTYDVTVNGSLYFKRTAGETVEIHAGTRAGFVFNHWNVNSGNVTLADAAKPSTSFVMPANHVTLTTVWSGDSPVSNIVSGNSNNQNPGEKPTDTSGSLENFKKTYNYTDGIFTDLPQNPEAAEWIVKAFEYGIIAGIGNNRFGSNSNMLVQEAITIAAKMHMIYTTGTAENLTYPDGFIEYAKEKKLIDSGFDGAYSRAATRAELVRIWAYILPGTLLTAQNELNFLPDVNENSIYYNEIAAFYKAGILTGADAIGTFNGGDNVIRAHAAVMFVKLIETDLRTNGREYG
jgi:hypothetical protein